MSQVANTYAPTLDAAQLWSALQHDASAHTDIEAFKRLDDRTLAGFVRDLLDTVHVADSAPSPTVTTRADFDAAVQLGVDDMRAGRVLTPQQAARRDQDRIHKYEKLLVSGRAH